MDLKKLYLSLTSEKNKHVMFWIKRPTPDRSAGCFCKIRCLSFSDNKIIVI